MAFVLNSVLKLSETIVHSKYQKQQNVARGL